MTGSMTETMIGYVEALKAIHNIWAQQQNVSDVCCKDLGNEEKIKKIDEDIEIWNESDEIKKDNIEEGNADNLNMSTFNSWLKHLHSYLIGFDGDNQKTESGEDVAALFHGNNPSSLFLLRDLISTALPLPVAIYGGVLICLTVLQAEKRFKNFFLSIFLCKKNFFFEIVRIRL
jgi:hypothetical protein